MWIPTQLLGWGTHIQEWIEVTRDNAKGKTIHDGTQNSRSSRLHRGRYGTQVSQVEQVPPGMRVHRLPASRYAIFTARCELPAAVIAAYPYINDEWLPTSGSAHAGTATLEWYDDRRRRGTEAEVDIYLPIIIKPGPIPLHPAMPDEVATGA